MKKNKCQILRGCLFFYGLILLLSGCASSPKHWYKSGHSQVDFDLDSRECAMIAREVGRDATILGEKVDLDVFTTSYNNCLFARGWTHTPLGKEAKNVQAVELAKIEGNRVFVFDRHLTLPSGFRLIRNQIAGFQDIRMQTLFFQGDGPVYLNMIIQEAVSRKFSRIDYPAKAPFFVYEKGKTDAKDHSVNWAVFSGDFKGEWVAGIGAYHLLNDTRRINLVMTRGISSPENLPPEGLKLTRVQKMEVDAFSDQWLEPVKLSFFQP